MENAVDEVIYNILHGKIKFRDLKILHLKVLINYIFLILHFHIFHNYNNLRCNNNGMK